MHYESIRRKRIKGDRESLQRNNDRKPLKYREGRGQITIQYDGCTRITPSLIVLQKHQSIGEKNDLSHTTKCPQDSQ